MKLGRWCSATIHTDVDKDLRSFLALIGTKGMISADEVKHVDEYK